MTIVTMLYIWQISPTSEQDSQYPIKPKPIRKYRFNNITVDFTLASEDFELQILNFVKDKTFKNSIFYYSTSQQIEKQLNVTYWPIGECNLVIASEITDEFKSLANLSTTYILFEETENLFNFTFDFVHSNPQWNHFYPPVVFVDNVTRLNFLQLGIPVILLKRAPVDYRPVLDTIWELQHPSDCDNVVTLFQFLKKQTFERVRDEAGCGMGCSVHYIHMSMQQAYEQRR